MIKGRNPGHICINLAHIARQSTIVGHPALLQMSCQSHATLPVNLAFLKHEPLPGGLEFLVSADSPGGLAQAISKTWFCIVLSSTINLTRVNCANAMPK